MPSPQPFYVCRIVMQDGRPAWLPEDKAISALSAEAALALWTADGTVAPGSVLAVPVGQVTRAIVSAGPSKVKLS